MGKFAVKNPSGVNTDGMRPRDGQDEYVYSDDIPPNIIFPDQLNRYLRDQIHSLTMENGGLKKHLEETQEELSAMREKAAKMSQPAPAGRVAEMAECKIAQLSKKLREQNAEMECLRTQHREAEAKLKRLEERSQSDGSAREEREVTPSESAEKDRQIRLLTDKLQASNAKLCDFRNQYQSLKQEMKLAQRVIENEIGEKCSIQDLAKENGNWRGRAQQILALQNKVQVLQEQISNVNGSENPSPLLLRQIERERRANYEETTKQLNHKTIQLEEMRKKLEAAKARNKVLENEIIQAKTRMNGMNEKGARDEQLISTLTNQISALEDRGKAQMQCFCKMQENVGKLQQELEVEKTKGDQLQKALSDRETRIRRMEEQMQEMRKTRAAFKPADREQCSTTDLTDKLTMTSPERPKIAEAERTRLLELVAVSNRRLVESRHKQDQAEAQLRKERYKNAKLETKIARLELEKLGAIKTGRGSYSRVAESNTSDEKDILARQHIEYLEEERLALKTRIETLQMERDDDLKAFASIAEFREFPTESETRLKANKRRVQRSPANTVISTNLRQSSISSDDFHYSDHSIDNKINYKI